MAADIAIGDRAENRVGDRMAQHIGVGMADERLIVRNLDAAEPDVIAGTEGMDVIALAHVGTSSSVRASLASATAISSAHRDLHIVRLAFENINRMSRPFRDRRVVGQALAPASRAPCDALRG